LRHSDIALDGWHSRRRVADELNSRRE